jgi:hypothetical protein
MFPGGRKFGVIMMHWLYEADRQPPPLVKKMSQIRLWVAGQVYVRERKKYLYHLN